MNFQKVDTTLERIHEYWGHSMFIKGILRTYKEILWFFKELGNC